MARSAQQRPRVEHSRWRAVARHHDRALQLLHGGVIGVYVLAITLGIFLPIYTDEIGWRFQERAGFDGVDKMFSDSCGANSLAKPPLFLWPLRAASAALNQTFAAPVWLRLSGIGYALLWGVLLVAVVRRVSADRAERLALATIGLSLMCLGTLPLLMVLSRPEQPIILASALAVLLALPPREGGAARSASGAAPAVRTAGAFAAWLRSLGIAILGAIALGYHVKALVLVPLFLAAIALASRGRAAILPRIAAAAALLAMTASAAQYWASRLACPDDPILRAEYARNSVGAVLAGLRSWSDVAPVIAGLWRGMNPLPYIALVAPEPFPLSYWLPAGQVSLGTSLAWIDVLHRLWEIVLVLGLIGLAIAIVDSVRQRRLDPRMVLALGVLAGVFGWGMTRLVRNFYEAPFLLPLLALAALLAMASLRGRLLRALRDLAAGVLGVAALVSVVLTIGIWRPSLWAEWQHPGYVDVRGHSVSIRGFAAIESDVRSAASLCAIPPPEHAHALLLDDITYFPYMRSSLPQYELGVLGLWHGTIRDPIAYLKSKQSDGALLNCHLLPPGLRARAKRVGDICCLAPPHW